MRDQLFYLIMISIIIVLISCWCIYKNYLSGSLKYVYHLLPHSFEPTIPRIIYKTGPKKESALPSNLKLLFKKTVQDNPGYTIQYFDDDQCRDFIAAHFNNEVLEVYDRLIPGAFKADLFRYCILYEKGGVYSDLTQQFKVPLNTLIDHHRDHLVLVADRAGIEIGGQTLFCGQGVQIAFMASRPKTQYI